MLIVALRCLSAVAYACPDGIVVGISLDEINDSQVAKAFAEEVYSWIRHLVAYGNYRCGQDFTLWLRYHQKGRVMI